MDSESNYTERMAYILPLVNTKRLKSQTSEEVLVCEYLNSRK